MTSINLKETIPSHTKAATSRSYISEEVVTSPSFNNPNPTPKNILVNSQSNQSTSSSNMIRMKKLKIVSGEGIGKVTKSSNAFPVNANLRKYSMGSSSGILNPLNSNLLSPKKEVLSVVNAGNKLTFENAFNFKKNSQPVVINPESTNSNALSNVFSQLQMANNINQPRINININNFNINNYNFNSQKLKKPNQNGQSEPPLTNESKNKLSLTTSKKVNKKSRKIQTIIDGNNDSFINEIADLLNNVEEVEKKEVGMEINLEDYMRKNKGGVEEVIEQEEKLTLKNEGFNQNFDSDPRINFEQLQMINAKRPQTSYGGISARQKSLQRSLRQKSCKMSFGKGEELFPMPHEQGGLYYFGDKL